MINKTNNISVFGLGYVGCITSSCLAYLRNKVIGVDVDKNKVTLINDAITPIAEPLLQEYLEFALENEYLYATTDFHYAINNSEITFICVSTPTNSDGSCNLNAISNVITSIGQALKHKFSTNKNCQRHIVVIRSTIPPGTIENFIIPTLEEHSNLKINKDFYVCFYPEFLREAKAIDDFFNPPEYVIGENESQHASDALIDLLSPYLNKYKDTVIKTNYRTAELIKYTDNVWHALKVAFANEIGTLAKSYGIDGRDLMTIFCSDHKLNISSYYLTPGLSYGGSCLPKDLQHVQFLTKKNNINLPLINSITGSNNLHLERTYQFITQHAQGTIGWYGLTFKPGTDDLRNSVQLELFAKLKKDFAVKFIDENININNLPSSSVSLLSATLGSNYREFNINNLIELLNSVDTMIFGHPITDELLIIINSFIDSLSINNSSLILIDLNEPNKDLSLNDFKNKNIQYFNIF